MSREFQSFDMNSKFMRQAANLIRRFFNSLSQELADSFFFCDFMD